MKYLLKIIILVAVIIWLLVLTSCTKQIEQPTCFRYLEIIERWDSEMIPMKPDTLYPNGRLSNYVCGSELKKLQDYKPRLEGCENGWQMITYQILK